MKFSLKEFVEQPKHENLVYPIALARIWAHTTTFHRNEIKIYQNPQQLQVKNETVLIGQIALVCLPDHFLMQT